jgi:hypothetical protein
MLGRVHSPTHDGAIRCRGGQRVCLGHVGGAKLHGVGRAPRRALGLAPCPPCRQLSGAFSVVGSEPGGAPAPSDLEGLSVTTPSRLTNRSYALPGRRLEPRPREDRGLEGPGDGRPTMVSPWARLERGSLYKRGSGRGSSTSTSAWEGGVATWGRRRRVRSSPRRPAGRTGQRHPFLAPWERR